MADVELILRIGEVPEEIPAGVELTRLLGGYAIAVLKEEQVEEFLQLPWILYAELPKRIFTQTELGRAESCISNRPSAAYVPDKLSGRGVLIGIVDSGIDYRHPDFCTEDGKTRIVALWDQSSGFGSPPEGYSFGTLFSEEQINLALRQESAEEGRRIVPEIDSSGHGTHVAGIAAGNGRASGGRYRGVAYESGLLVVKLLETRQQTAPASDTARLMEAVDFCLRFAINRNQPLALNLSYGTNEGAHNGRSLLEAYLNTASALAKCVMVAGTGNEGIGRRHTGGVLTEGEAVSVEVAVTGAERSVELELWKNYADDFRVELVSPEGQAVELSFDEGEAVDAFGSVFLFSARENSIRLSAGEVEGLWSAPTIYQNLSELRLSITAYGERLGQGIWTIRLIPEKIVKGEYDIWLLRGTENSQSGFVVPVAERTLTIPSTAEGVISVGAYDIGTLQTAPFSGRGPARETGRMKPDLVAPGVDIMSCAPGGGYTVRTGTSMATPFVTGGAALLMQWGMVEGNDPYLYGEKMREYLLRGANRLPGETYPNPVDGWGRLCVNNSFPA